MCSNCLFFLFLGIYSDSEDKKKDSESIIGSGGAPPVVRGSGSPISPPTDVIHPKPRIWSLADMATSGGLSSASSAPTALSMGGAGKIMSESVTRGLHLQGAPYPRPLFPHGAYPYISPSVSESILSYSKSLVAANFPPASLSEIPSNLLAPSPLVHDFARHDLSRPDVLRHELSRHELHRPELLARPEPHRPDPRQPVEKDV